MYQLEITDHRLDGPDGQEVSWTIALYQRESDAEDMKRMLTDKFPDYYSFYYYEIDDTIPINPTYAQLCDLIEKDVNPKTPEIVAKEACELWEKVVGEYVVNFTKDIKETEIFAKTMKDKSYLEIFKGE